MKKTMRYFSLSPKKAFTPFSIFLLMAALTLGMFYGCQKENTLKDYSSTGLSKSEEDKLLIVEAKAYFESRLEQLKQKKEADKNKLKVRDNQTADATFDGLDVFPKWDDAKVIRQNGSSFVEIPYVLEGNKQSGRFISKNNNIAHEEKGASRLIVKKNKRGIKSANFMSVSADDEYLNGNNTSLKNFTYDAIPNHFKGNEMHFNLDGSYKYGWHFSDGKVNGTIEKTKVNSLGTRDECDVRFCEVVERWTVSSIYGSQTFTVSDCSYTMRLLFCQGWLSPAELWDYNNASNWVDTYPSNVEEPPVKLIVDEEYACASNFDFNNLSNCSQKQEAGISGLYTNISYKIEKEDANGQIIIESGSIHVELETLYFVTGFKDVDCESIVTPARAASAAASSINNGEDNIRKIVERGETLDPNILKQAWLNHIRYQFDTATPTINGGLNYVKTVPSIDGLNVSVKPYIPCN
jgi:hypothetical protein